MRQLLRKDVKFLWNKDCQSEFQNLIDKLTHTPILQPMDVDQDFHIYTDGSYFGTGYAAFQLSNNNPDQFHVIGYGGQALTPKSQILVCAAN